MQTIQDTAVWKKDHLLKDREYTYSLARKCNEMIKFMEFMHDHLMKEVDRMDEEL